MPHTVQVSSARHITLVPDLFSENIQVFESFIIESTAISDVALNHVVADSFCLASRLTGDKAD